jgi:uncharacterized delta-60 repeat protein
MLSMVALVAAWWTVPVAADAGAFDPSFGQGGLSTVPGLMSGNDAAMDAAGRIVVVGGASPIEGDIDLGLARLLTDGTLDPEFGDGGQVRTDLGANETGSGVAIQADGRIVAAGTRWAWYGREVVLVARYRPGGGLDPTFSDDGFQRVDVTTEQDVGVQGVAVLQGGRIAVVGSFGWRDGAPTPFVVLLGTAGRVRTVLIESAWPEGASFSAVIPWSGGGFMVAGSRASTPSRAGAMLAVRYRADGSRDLSFSGDGARVVRFARDGWAFSLARASQGRVVLSGQVAGQTGPAAAVVRLGWAGVRDRTFGDDGIAILDPFRYSYDQAMAVAVDEEGRTVVGVRTSTSDTSIAAVARLTYRGDPDPTFGVGGRVEGALGPDSAIPSALLVVPQPGYVVAGTTGVETGDPHGVVSRLLAS